MYAMPSLGGYATRWTFASNPGSTRREHATVTDLLDKVYYIELTLYIVLSEISVAILRMTSLPVFTRSTPWLFAKILF